MLSEANFMYTTGIYLKREMSTPQHWQKAEARWFIVLDLLLLSEHEWKKWRHCIIEVERNNGKNGENREMAKFLLY